MEVAAADDPAAARRERVDRRDAAACEDERVVGRRVELDIQHATEVIEGIADGAVHLWNATERVRVLDLVHRGVMAVLELALAQDVAELCRDRHLARVRPRELVRRRERDIGPKERLDAHRRDDRGGPDEPVGVGQQECPDRPHQLRPVEEREPFLRPEFQRFQADFLKRLHRRHGRPVELDLAAPDERQRQVRERREVAGCPDAALFRHDRVDAVRQVREEPVDDQRPAAAVAQRERVGPQQEHRADDLARKGRPDARRVAHQQPALELARALWVHERRREVPEAGRHPVHHGTLGDEGLDDVARLLHPLTRVDIEGDRCAAAGDGLDVGDRQVRAGQDHRVGPATVRVEVRDLRLTHRAEDSRLSSVASLDFRS